MKNDIEKLLNNLGQRLKAIRKDKGLTQEDLGKISGISYKAIAQYEVSSKKIPSEKLITLAHSLGLTVEELIGLKKVELVNSDISFSTLKKARVIDKLPTRAKNEVFNFINEKADKAGVEN